MFYWHREDWDGCLLEKFFTITQAKEVEKQAIQDGIQENGVEDCDKVIQSVLAARHAAEEQDIDTEYAALKKLMVDDAIAKLHEKYNKMTNELAKKHEQQLRDLEVRHTKILSLFFNLIEINMDVPLFHGHTHTYNRG